MKGTGLLMMILFLPALTISVFKFACSFFNCENIFFLDDNIKPSRECVNL